MSDEVIVLNEGLESRTSKTGKTRYTIRVTAEPIAVNLDAKALGAPVAQAIAHHFRERVRGISAVAAPATLKARESAQRAFKAGKAWAMKRYAGGRIGPMEPNQTNTAFNDSRRFADSITANASKDNAWRINVAANRLDERTAGASGVQRIWQRLVQLVPEFGNPALLMQSDIIRASVKRAQQDMIKVARATTGKLEVSRVKALFDVGRGIANLFSA